MSTIVSSFVKDRVSAAQLPTASLISGAAKAWATIDVPGGVPVLTPALAFNVSSLNDLAIGYFGANYGSPFARAYLPVLVTPFHGSSGGVTAQLNASQAASMQWSLYLSTAVNNDFLSCFATCGDLA